MPNRRFLLPVVLGLALLLLAPVVLRAGDDDEDDATARLERRVEMLIDIVSRLQAEVRALSERVDRLEAAAAQPQPSRVRAEPEEVPLEPAPAVAPPDPTGVYDLDADASVSTILETQLEGVEDETEREAIRKSVAEEFEGLAVTLTLAKDGTFSVRLASEGVEHTARGTWERPGEDADPTVQVVLTTTHEDDAPAAHPTSLAGSMEAGRLTLREQGEGGDDGYVMVFVKR